MKILVLYYSQTGQLQEIAKNCLSPLVSDPLTEVDFVKVETEHTFPFPWTRLEFFNAFPESVYGTPFKLKPIEVDDSKNYDLVVLAYTVWYLNPSIPISSLLQHPAAQRIFNGKKVITLLGSRNMWVLAQEKVKRHLKNLQADLIGNIVLIDRNKNLVSIITIIRWMFYGKKDPFWGFPRAGIIQDDIEKSSRFGKVILNRLKSNDLSDMQQELNALGAVEINPSLVILEKRATKLFGMYAGFLSKKGGFYDRARMGRVSLLSYLLPIGAFILSPITTISSFLISVIKRKELSAEIRYYKQNSLNE
ncbi:MAG: dialkylresorcinol condensing enzyme DarA [Flavobacteriales bacterium]|nr:dialkylresorcinol condensing enzyme DarA [Flavobacteriales bacterium]